VDDERGTGLRASRQIDGLIDGQVATGRVVLAGAPQRRLDQQEVGAQGEVDHGLVRAGIAGVDEPGAVWSLDRQPPRGNVMTAPHEADRQGSDPEGGLGVVFGHVEGGVEEPRSFRDGDGKGIKARPATGWQVDLETRVGPLGPREEIAQAGHVEVVVRMHMADDHGREFTRVEDVLEAANHALPDVEEQGRVLPLDEVA